MSHADNEVVLVAQNGGMRVKINGRSFSLSWDDFLKALTAHEDLSAIEVIVPGLPLSAQ